MTKCDDDLRVHLSSALKNDLFRLAENDGRTLSDYVRYLLELHVHGHRKKILVGARGPGRESQETSVPDRDSRMRVAK